MSEIEFCSYCLFCTICLVEGDPVSQPGRDPTVVVIPLLANCVFIVGPSPADETKLWAFDGNLRG